MKRIKVKNAGGWGKLCLVLFMGCIGLQQARAAAEVWVSDARGSDATGNGTYDSPYKTIQKGVDMVEAGGTVKIQAGTYGIGEEHVADSHTNRVVISGKSVTLDGVDGKDVTHLVGRLDPNSEYGASPAAVRCIYIADKTAAADTVIKNLTLREGGADSKNTNTGKPYGYGGAVSTYSNGYGTAWLVDCVISNSVACMGGALLGVNALRCLIVDCTSSGFGAATRYSRLMHCLVLRNRATGSERPALSYSMAVNCTVAFSPGTKTQGIGRSVSAYNCISFGNSASDIVATGSYPVTETNNCYVTSDDAHLLFSTAVADYRVTAGTLADNGGLTTHFSKITLPAGERADIDFAGNTFDINKTTCDAGCIQGAATPAGGHIVFRSPYIVEGVSNGVGGETVYYTPETWPVSVRARPIVNNSTNYICANPLTGSYGAGTLRRIFPLMDGSHLFTPPPSASKYLSFNNVVAGVVVYARPGADAATADGSEAHPYPTLQAAVNSVTNASTESPLILAFPGIYDEGGAEVGGVFTRLVLPGDKYYTVRSLEGPERTVIKGAADASNTGDYAGCGPAAVRCVAINNTEGTATPSVIQGFTLADGHTRCDATDNTEACYGGGLLGMADNNKKSQLLDCIVTNCAAVCGGASHNATLFRSKLYDCHGYGGVLRSTRLVSCYVDPSCTLGSAPAGTTAGAVFGTATTSILGTAPEATAVNGNNSLYNTLFASHAPQANATMWGSVTTNAAAIASTKGCAYVSDANFADLANGDWRLSTTTPARYASRLPASGTSVYNAWAEDFTIWVQGDIDGNPLCVTDGVPLPGCWQTTVGPKSAFVEVAQGGLAVAGGTIGDNVVDSDSFALTLSPGIGSRPCCGYAINGRTNYFADVASGTVTAADVAASEYGVVVSALYSTDWYVSPTGDDVLNGGSTAATPKKTLAAIMALAEAGDTVHAAAGTYDQGSMKVDTTAWDHRARVRVPTGVTLVADEGPEVTFIVGAPDTTESKNEYGMGTNALRCVYMQANAHLKGFTVTGGYTWWDAEGYTDRNRDYSGNWSGGGICGHSQGRDNVLVEDCIISNNWALWAGGSRYANLVRCRLFENHALLNGGAIRDAHAYGCVIDRNYSGSGSNRASCYYYTRIVGCTLGPHNYKLDGTSALAVYGASSEKAIFHDNLVLGSTGAKGSLTNTVTGCVFANSSNSFPTNETCLVVPSNELEVDEYLRPIVGKNAAVDRGSVAALTTHSGGLIPLDKDLYGFQRVMNGTVDVGALEGDWRPMYAKLLDGTGRRLQITAADSGVCTNDVGGVAAVVLHDGEDLSFAWSMANRSAPRRGKVQVTGTGTLALTHNGETFATFTEADGVAEFTLPAAWLDAFAFAFEGEGSADLFGFAAPVGTTLSFR